MKMIIIFLINQLSYGLLVDEVILNIKVLKLLQQHIIITPKIMNLMKLDINHIMML